MMRTSLFCIPVTARPYSSFFFVVHLVLIILWKTPIAQAGWKECPGGGGVCPDHATCCPSATPGGSPPGCISKAHGKEPLDATGICCDETTACPSGFTCGVKTVSTSTVSTLDETRMRDDDEESKGNNNDDDDDDDFDRIQEEKDEHHHHHPYCKIDTENPPVDLFHDQPRYQMCRIPDPSVMTVMYGFPILTERRRNRQSSSADTYQLAYYSSHGDLLLQQWNNDESSPSANNNKMIIEKVLIMIHGSKRTAEDYFCVALSLVPEADRDRVLVIAPKFLAPEDDLPTTTSTTNSSFLIWQEDEDPPKYPMSHSWRYGADALNAPVSSYEAIDRLVEYLISSSSTSKMNNGDRQHRLFSNLKQVSIAGHSAGGQVVHRWALLSKIPHEKQNVEIRVVAANPRSYCYLNGKRMILQNKNTSNTTTRWEYPSAQEIEDCPDYNQWNWGLETGGALDPVVPYFVRRMKESSSSQEVELAMEYVRRKVTYLTGEYDVLPRKGGCATYEWQGTSRHERAMNYFEALKAYVQEHDAIEQLNHELHTIPESPHDFILMFQSAAGRQAIFGDGNVQEDATATWSTKSTYAKQLLGFILLGTVLLACRYHYNRREKVRWQGLR